MFIKSPLTENVVHTTVPIGIKRPRCVVKIPFYRDEIASAEIVDQFNRVVVRLVRLCFRLALRRRGRLGRRSRLGCLGSLGQLGWTGWLGSSFLSDPPCFLLLVCLFNRLHVAEGDPFYFLQGCFKLGDIGMAPTHQPVNGRIIEIPLPFKWIDADEFRQRLIGILDGFEIVLGVMVVFNRLPPVSPDGFGGEQAHIVVRKTTIRIPIPRGHEGLARLSLAHQGFKRVSHVRNEMSVTVMFLGKVALSPNISNFI